MFGPTIVLWTTSIQTSQPYNVVQAQFLPGMVAHTRPMLMLVQPAQKRQHICHGLLSTMGRASASLLCSAVLMSALYTAQASARALPTVSLLTDLPCCSSSCRTCTAAAGALPAATNAHVPATTTRCRSRLADSSRQPTRSSCSPSLSLLPSGRYAVDFCEVAGAAMRQHRAIKLDAFGYYSSLAVALALHTVYGDRQPVCGTASMHSSSDISE